MVMELGTFLWETFSYTGSIDAYLLYKNTCDEDKQEEEECQISTQEVL